MCFKWALNLLHFSHGPRAKSCLGAKLVMGTYSNVVAWSLYPFWYNNLVSLKRVALPLKNIDVGLRKFWCKHHPWAHHVLG